MLLVCGGRSFSGRDAVYEALDLIGPQVVVHGAAPGADSLAGRWANEHGVEERPFPAMWKTFGLAAGPIRNQAMLDSAHPNMVLAFPGGAGTADMVSRAKAAGVKVVTYEELLASGVFG